MSNYLTKKEIIKNIKDTEALGYFTGNEANWSDKKATDNMLMKLQNEGILAYEMNDDIFINAEWITDGEYNENCPFVSKVSKNTKNTKNTKNIVSFSGGKDSTAMLLMMIEKGIQIDEIANIDTTKEFPGMYEHIEKVKQYIPQDIKFTTLSFDFDYYLSDHIKTKGKNKGKKGYGWPCFSMRWCTGEKKEQLRQIMKKYNNDEIINYQGIAYDEKQRLYKNKFIKYKVIYPLVDWQITEKQALQYCYDKGLTWNGLYEDFERVSCWCCPLSRIGELKTLYFKYPELWQELKKMDKKSFRKFKPDYSIDELEVKFAK